MHAATATSSCKTQTFTSSSIIPSTVRPGDQVTVKCNYGKRLDCLSVVGAGLNQCVYSRFEGSDTIFTCTADENPGYYDDAKCIVSKGTDDDCCAASNPAGNMTVLGTDVSYDQDLVLPFGKYTLSAKVLTQIAQGKGVRVMLVCNSATCANSTKKNGIVYSLSFPVSTVYEEKLNQSIRLSGSGDDRHYLLRLSVDRGSEALFDYVSLKNASGKEIVQNGEFGAVVQNSVRTSQPASWGEGDNRVGYYYGSLLAQSGNTVSNLSATSQLTSPTTTGSSSASGATSTGSVTLALKIALQGITKKPANSNSINVQIKLGGGGLSSPTAYQTVPFTVNDEGVWSGQATFPNIVGRGGYRVYVKGPKQLQKKICDSVPTESKAGGYHCADGNITLKSGTNTLDFSKIVILSGDVPENEGKQNGIIDSYDTTVIRQNLGTAEPSKLAIGDLNFDNIVDSQDYSIVLQALSIKYDEE